MVDAAVGELAVFDSVQHVGLDLSRTEWLGAAVEVACHSGHSFYVIFLGTH